MVLLKKLKKPCRISYQTAAKLQNISRNILVSFVYLLITPSLSKVPVDISK